MPTELEELVVFLHHGNTQIRQAAVEHLVPYSMSQPLLFKSPDRTPIKDLKLLVKDYTPIAKNALTMLVNLSGVREVLKDLANDDGFLETILLRITENAKESNANLLAMLLANLSKSDSIGRLLELRREAPLGLSKSKLAVDQLLDVFVRGAAGGYNENADFDYLAYLFADLAKFPQGTAYFTAIQGYDGVHPISKLLPFTTHTSHIRRLGVASAVKNVSFTPSVHPTLLESPLEILPFLQQPIMSGSDSYSEEETDKLPEELQLLDPNVEREADVNVLKTHLESLLLLTSTREGRDKMRATGIYPIVRECHLHVEDEGVRETCDRIVQVIMRDEEGEESKIEELGDVATKPGSENASGGRMLTTQEVESDEDEKVVDIL